MVPGSALDLQHRHKELSAFGQALATMSCGSHVHSHAQYKSDTAQGIHMYWNIPSRDN